jgi:hypothetical protein
MLSTNVFQEKNLEEVTFIKIILMIQGEKRKLVQQELSRNSFEEAFGVLRSKFAIMWFSPSLAHGNSQAYNICCIILHVMIITGVNQMAVV